MSLTGERDKVAELFITGWTVNGAYVTPVAWPNRKFTPPSQGPWCRFSIVNADAFRLTIGGITNVTRHVGAVIIQLFDNVGKGDAELRGLADTVSSIFRDKTIDGGTYEQIVFRSPVTSILGTDSTWYQINCTVPFVRDSII